MAVRKKRLKWIFWTVIVTLLLTILYANIRSPHVKLDYVIPMTISVEEAAFAKNVGDLLDPAFTQGNSVKTLLNGDEIFPAMLKAIRSARKSITFESYIYWSGKIGEQFAVALAEKAKAGIPVHLLLDWAGSGKIDDKMLKLMEESGVEIERYHEPRWYNITRMNNRTHRKVLVVDGEIGFTGGVGIADEWTGNGLDPEHWRDTHYEVRGPVVNQMQSAFMDNWLKTHSRVLIGPEYFPSIKPAGKSRAQMFISSADEGGSSVRIMYLMAIESARKSIYLESAYFVPDEHTIGRLTAARERGVDVRIIVPGEHTDSDVVNHASREKWGPLLKAGVRIFRYQPAMYHCKVLIVDGIFSSVGSTNFDERSFRLNDEANLNVIDRDFAARQTADFKADAARSKEVTFEEWEKRPASEKWMGKISSILDAQL